MINMGLMPAFRFPQRSAPAGFEEGMGAQTPLSYRLDQARARGAQDLTLSNPTRAGLDYSVYGPTESWLTAGLVDRYRPEPLGCRSTREAIAAGWMGAPPQPRPEAIVVCPSSSVAYQYLLTLLCDPGDGVLAPQPSYPLFDALARYAGVELQRYRLRYDGGWHVDLDSLQRAVNSRTRAALIVNPNNPTGSSLANDELAAFSALGLPLIVDEVFRAFPLKSRGSESTFARSESLMFCLDGLSKSAGLPQVKLSWIALSGPQALVHQALQRLSFITDTYLPVSALAEQALPHLLDCAPAFQEQLRTRLADNQRTLDEVLRNSPATALRPEAGWSTVVRLPDVLGEADEDAWTRLLMEQANLVVHPGYFYDLEHGPHIVLSRLAEPGPFRTAIGRLRKVVERTCDLG